MSGGGEIRTREHLTASPVFKTEAEIDQTHDGIMPYSDSNSTPCTPLARNPNISLTEELELFTSRLNDGELLKLHIATHKHGDIE